MTAFETITSFDPLPAAAPKPAPAAPRRGRNSGPQSRYDAAQTAEGNRRHWANADHLSASAANSPDVRARLRSRSRYEIANNGYAEGLILRRTNDTVGTGPRLQIDLPETTYDADFDRTLATGTPRETAADLARKVELRWCEWAKATGLVDKLRLAVRAEDADGEAFVAMVTNPALPASGPQLDLRVYEADQCSTPDLLGETPTACDGIVYDAAGNPVEYHFLKQHPGDSYFGFGAVEYARVPASRVIHLFELRRPGQRRGVPVLTPGLPLYAILRRYTLASLLTAEAQARINAVIESEHSPVDPDADVDEDDGGGEQIHFAGTQMLTLTAGQKAHTLQPSAPGPSYREFKGEVLAEAGRSTGAARNTSIGSSAEYNYSSGRLDHLPGQLDTRIRRERTERCLLSRAFAEWLAEAVLIPGYLPDGLPPVESWKACWFWDGFPSIDPLKDANAAKVRKEIGLTTDAEELAREGKDWREHYTQLAREKDERKRLGIEPPPPKPASAVNAPDREELADA